VRYARCTHQPTHPPAQAEHALQLQADEDALEERRRSLVEREGALKSQLRATEALVAKRGALPPPCCRRTAGGV